MHGWQECRHKSGFFMHDPCRKRRVAPGSGGYPGSNPVFWVKKNTNLFFSSAITTIINKECAAPVYIRTYTDMHGEPKMRRIRYLEFELDEKEKMVNMMVM